MAPRGHPGVLGASVADARALPFRAGVQGNAVISAAFSCLVPVCAFFGRAGVAALDSVSFASDRAKWHYTVFGRARRLALREQQLLQ
jgi:hypothetical protein